MSSNHVYIRKREWNDMRERIRRDEALLTQTQEEAARIRRLLNERERQVSIARENAQRRLNSAIQSLRDAFNENLGRVQGQVNVTVQNNRERFEGQLQNLTARLSNSSSRLNEINDRVENIANTFNASFREYMNQLASAREKALAVRDELERLMSQIEALNPSKFTAREYAELSSLRRYIADNIAAGDHQAALAISQSGIVDASRLLARLIIDNETYDERMSVARETDARIRERVERLSSPQSVLRASMDGQDIEWDYDIRRWSHGRFDELVSRLTDIENRINSDTTTAEQLERLIGNLNVLEDELQQCDLHARDARCSSIAAAESAERIHQILSGNGWTLIDSGYIDGDDRNPYRIIYEDNAGNRSAIVVTPEGASDASYFMEVFSENESLAAQTKRGLYETLSTDGLAIGEPEVRNDCQLNTDPDEFINEAAEEALEHLEETRRQH